MHPMGRRRKDHYASRQKAVIASFCYPCFPIQRDRRLLDDYLPFVAGPGGLGALTVVQLLTQTSGQLDSLGQQVQASDNVSQSCTSRAAKVSSRCAN